MSKNIKIDVGNYKSKVKYASVKRFFNPLFDLNEILEKIRVFQKQSDWRDKIKNFCIENGLELEAENTNINVLFKLVNPDIIISVPEYATEGSSGMDIRSSVECLLEPGEWKLIPTNISVEIPEGFEIQVRPRSGLAVKNGVTVLNSPGTIDSSYRGEIKVILVNHGKIPFSITQGDRIAQIVLAKVEKMEFKLSDTLSETERGEGGFGSTGTK